MSKNQPSPLLFKNLLPWLLFAVAFGYRLFGISWGLPNELHNYTYHPDEEIVWQGAEHVVPAKLQFTPKFYNYGTFYLTLEAIASDVVAGYGGGPKDDDPGSEMRYYRLCVLAGRLLSSLAGAGTVLILFLAFKRFTNEFGAALGSLVVAFAPGYVVHSRFETVDVTATFLLAVSAYFALKLLPVDTPAEGETRSWDKPALLTVLWSGVFAGLSAGTKYTGILGLLTLFVAILCAGRGKLLKPMAVALVSGLLALVVATPGILLDSERFFRDFRYEALHTSQGHGILFTDVGSGFGYHIINLIEGLTPFPLLLGVAGVIWAAFQRQKWAWALLAFAVPYYLLIGRAEVLFLRYTFPLYIVLAGGVAALSGFGHEKKGKGLILAVVGIFAVGFALMGSAQYTALMMGPDARDITAAGFKRKAQESMTGDFTVGMPNDPWYYSPPFVPDAPGNRGLLPVILDELLHTSKPKVVRYIPADGKKQDWDVRLLNEVKPDYVVFSSFEVGDVARLTKATNLNGGDQALVDQFKAFHTLLEAQYDQIDPPVSVSNSDLAARYSMANTLVHDLAYVRPIIWIWKRKDSKTVP